MSVIRSLWVIKTFFPKGDGKLEVLSTARKKDIERELHKCGKIRFNREKLIESKNLTLEEYRAVEQLDR